MSLFKSWIPNRTLRTEYDIPLWQTHEPQAFPPAPITASMYSPSNVPIVEEPEETPRTYDLVLLQRREKFYHQKLQDLVDAQSDGLIKGLGGAAEDENDSVDTPTQTTYSQRSNSVSRSPAPHQKTKPSLAAARRGIWKTVLDCAAVKEEEDALLRQEMRDEQAVLEQLQVWESKENGLKEKISVIESDDTGAKSIALKEEASRLQGEINDMELRLSQMKTRHNQIMAEITQVESSVRSKLSSYKTSLGMLQKDVTMFLKTPPIKDERYAPESPFLSLPAHRRTLEMAKDYWSNDIDQLKRQRKQVRRDRAALEEGAVVWKEVISEVTAFEGFLKDEMSKLGRLESTSKGKSRANSPGPKDNILEQMALVSAFISEKLELAHTKKWRLLEVCIEAELQAFQQGKEMFEEIFNMVQGPPVDNRDADSEGEQLSGQSSTKDLFASAHEEGMGSHGAILHKSMYEDPDPDLLFTRREPDDDTE